MRPGGSFTHGPYSPVVGALLPLAVVALLVALRVGHKPGRAGVPRWARPLLLLSLALAAGNYVAFGEFRYDSYMNEWDVTHYYTGTKYAAELGYFHQYEAIWLADHDTGLRSTARDIRDLRSYAMIGTDDVLSRADAIRARFSPERWREFCADVAWLKLQLPAARWTLLTEDHGHNAPPTWTAAVGTIADLLSVRHGVARWALLLIDPLLLLGAIAALAWAYGLEAAALCAVLFGTHYFFSWGHLKGSMVRTDFVTFAVFAICLLRKQRPYLAGVCAAVAACSRAFPIFFLAGPLVLLLAGAVRERTLDRQLVRFFVGTAATATLAAGYAVWRLHDVGIFADWAAKMALHVDSHVGWNVGFRTIFNTGLDLGAGADLAAVDTHLSRLETWMLWGARLAVLVPALYFTRAMTPASAYGFSYLVMFYLVAPVQYYAMVLCLPLLYWAAEPASWSRTVGLAWLLLTGVLGYLLYYGWAPLRAVPLFEGYGLGFTNTLVMTWLITLGTLHMIAQAAGKARSTDAARTATASARISPGPAPPAVC